MVRVISFRPETLNALRDENKRNALIENLAAGDVAAAIKTIAPENATSREFHVMKHKVFVPASTLRPSPRTVIKNFQSRTAASPTDSFGSSEEARQNPGSFRKSSSFRRSSSPVGVENSNRTGRLSILIDSHADLNQAETARTTRHGTVPNMIKSTHKRMSVASLSSRSADKNSLVVRPYVDFSWRKRPQSSSNPTTTFAAATLRSRVSDLSADTSEHRVLSPVRMLTSEERRAALFKLFAEYDHDQSGTLEPREIFLLLRDMGHAYSEDEVRSALKHITNREASIEMEDFFQWWSCIEWFHGMGIIKGALESASIRYAKERQLEAAAELRQEVGALAAMQRNVESEHIRATRSLWKRIEAEGLVQPRATSSSSKDEDDGPPPTAELLTANDFFSFAQTLKSKT